MESRAAIVALDVHPHRTRLLRRRTSGERRVATADLRSFAASESLTAACGCTLHRNWDAGASSRIKWRLRGENIVNCRSSRLSSCKQPCGKCTRRNFALLHCSLEPEECEQVVEGAMREATGKDLNWVVFPKNCHDCRTIRFSPSRTLSVSHKAKFRTYPGVHRATDSSRRFCFGSRP